MEWFLEITTGGDWFLSLGDKSKQRYKTKTNNIQGYDPFQIKKEELSGNISKFPLVAYPHFVNYLLFSLNPLTKQALKTYICLKSYDQFVSRK